MTRTFVPNFNDSSNAALLVPFFLSILSLLLLSLLLFALPLALLFSTLDKSISIISRLTLCLVGDISIALTESSDPLAPRALDGPPPGLRRLNPLRPAAAEVEPAPIGHSGKLGAISLACINATVSLGFNLNLCITCAIVNASIPALRKRDSTICNHSSIFGSAIDCL